MHTFRRFLFAKKYESMKNEQRVINMEVGKNELGQNCVKEKKFFCHVWKKSALVSVISDKHKLDKAIRFVLILQFVSLASCFFFKKK